MSEFVPTLYMVCGIVAAGKSTLCQELASRRQTILVSEDHWNSTLFPGEINTIDDYRRCSKRVRQAIGPHVTELLKAGLSVVLDFPANTVPNRNWMKGIFESAAAASELHFLDVPVEICKARLRLRNSQGEHPYQTSDADFEKIVSYFVAPELDEGFNIVRHRD